MTMLGSGMENNSQETLPPAKRIAEAQAKLNGLNGEIAKDNAQVNAIVKTLLPEVMKAGARIEHDYIMAGPAPILMVPYTANSTLDKLTQRRPEDGGLPTNIKGALTRAVEQELKNPPAPVEPSPAVSEPSGKGILSRAKALFSKDDVKAEAAPAPRDAVAEAAKLLEAYKAKPASISTLDYERNNAAHALANAEHFAATPVVLAANEKGQAYWQANEQSINTLASHDGAPKFDNAVKAFGKAAVMDNLPVIAEASAMNVSRNGDSLSESKYIRGRGGRSHSKTVHRDITPESPKFAVAQVSAIITEQGATGKEGNLSLEAVLKDAAEGKISDGKQKPDAKAAPEMNTARALQQAKDLVKPVTRVKVTEANRAAPAATPTAAKQTGRQVG